jgi:hypothetical protein
MEANTVYVSTSYSPVIPLILLAVLLILPIKAGAHFADAKRTGVIWCAATAAIGILAGAVVSRILGGSLGGPLAAFIGFVVAIRYMLGTTLMGALGLTIVATGLSIVGFMVLAKVF